MSTAFDYELEEAQRQTSPSVAPQGPRQRGEAPPAPKPTGAREWKRDAPETHTLPSGNVAVLLRPSMSELIRHGKIPNPLIEAALALTQGSRPDDIGEVMELLDFLIAASFVEPRISLEEECEPDEIPVAALSDADRNYVLIWAQRGVAGLRSFRLDAESPHGGGDGGDVRDASE